MSGAVALMGGAKRRLFSGSITAGVSTTRVGYNIDSTQPAYGAIAPSNTYNDAAAPPNSQTIASLHWDSAANALRLTLVALFPQGQNLDETFKTLRVNGIAFARASAAFGANSPQVARSTWAWVVANPIGAGGAIVPVSIEF